MNTGVTRFKKGNQVAKNKTGKKHMQTLINDSLRDSMKQLDGRLFELTCEFLNSRNVKVRFSAWKELLKYKLPVIRDQKDLSENMTKTLIIENYK